MAYPFFTFSRQTKKTKIHFFIKKGDCDKTESEKTQFFKIVREMALIGTALLAPRQWNFD